MSRTILQPSLPAIALITLFQLVLGPAFGATVYRDHVEPHWSGRQSQFWYRNSLPGNRSEFVWVDAEAGIRKPAFDHARVAESLGKILQRPVMADHLPIDRLDFEMAADSVVIIVSGDRYLLNLKSYELRREPNHVGGDSLISADSIHPSRASDRHTSIAFDNTTAGVIALFWIDTEGKRHRYASIPPNERYEQPTYSGHTWLATNAAGEMLGIFDATDEPATAVVDGKHVGARAPKTPSKHDESRRGPVSPNGKWVAVVNDNNLHLREKETGKDFRLTDDGVDGNGYSESDVWWSPDSQYLVAMQTEAAQKHPIFTVESSPKDQIQPKLRTLEYLKPGDKIAHPRPKLFHVADHSQVRVGEELFTSPWSIERVRWADDSSRFTFVYNQRGHQVLRVVAIDAATGNARAIVDETSPTFIDYSGKYFCQWVSDRELIWMSERDGWNHLWLYDAIAGKATHCITPGPWVVQNVVHIDEAARQVWFNAGGVRAGEDPYYTHFCRANFDGSGFVILTEGNGTHSVQWSPGEKYLIDTWSRVDQPPVIELRRAADGKLQCKLEEADASEAFTAMGGHWPARFVSKGRDGITDIFGVIILPGDFDAAKKYPVVEQVYAGPHSFFAPKAFRADYGTRQKIANLGMILVQSDGMGTSGRSKKFHDICWKNLRDAGFPDRIAWIKSAGEKFPQMDLARVGIYGGSAGGQSAMGALLWHNDFYKVAVADCGCHDNRMDKIWWNEQWMGWPVDKSYEDNSNVTNAGLMKGKLMLIVGELDDNVDPSSTMQVVNALEKANKDFDLVIVTGAHHGAAETKYGSRRRAEFLATNLLKTAE